MSPLGQKPAGTIVRTSEVVIEVMSVNYENINLTVKAPLRIVTVMMDKDVRNLYMIKTGDKIYLRFTEALAVAVNSE